jgi:hypothetical protein
MEKSQEEKCTNTSFLDRYQLSVIHGDADNDNHTKISEKAYLYQGLGERH